VKIKAAMLVALAGLSVSPAFAQSRWVDEPGYYLQGLPLRVIVRTVRMQGLTPVSRPLRRDNVYMVEAVDEFGRPRRVLVDARSARVIAVQPSARPAPGPNRGGTYAMRPPRVIPGGTGLPPRALPGEQFEAGRRAGPPPLPPLRRPRIQEGALSPAPMLGEDAVPPPPLRREGGPAQGAPRTSPPRTATVNPTYPPAPRPRPSATELTTGSLPSKPKGLPRVVLPGGPLPKSERTTDNQPGQREFNDKPAQAAAPAAPALESMAAQPTPPPAPGASEIPPAQTLE
jgi:hypothetical protein